MKRKKKIGKTRKCWESGLRAGMQEALDKVPKPMLQALLLQQSKGADYNARTKRSDYFPLGLASYAQEIHKKGLRLVNLAQSRQEVKHESVRDTALDLINYACFLAEAVDAGEI